MTDPAPTVLAASAVALAERGWAVLPLQPRGKQPHGKLAARGLHSASSDPDVVRSWWAEEPEANIGVATGASGLVVIDLDGAEAAAAWAELAGGQSPTAVVKTGRGSHLYYAAPAGDPVRNSAGKLAPNIDVRGEGGYVVAPPSVHPSGAQYAWEVRCAPVALPAWLGERLRAKPKPPPLRLSTSPSSGASAYAQRALDAEVAAVVTAPSGTRNHRLNEAAFNLGQLVGGGALTEAEVTDALLRAASAGGRGEPKEDAATVRSGLSSGMAAPRKPPEPTPPPASGRWALGEAIGAGAAGPAMPPSSPTHTAPAAALAMAAVASDAAPAPPVEPDEDDWRTPGLWPAPMHGVAFTGPLGKAAMALSEWVESGRENLLLHLLAMAGNAMGRGLGLMQGASLHGTALHVLIVGPSGIGRKGTALAPVKRVMERATSMAGDKSWAELAVRANLSTGEGLLYAVRDARWSEQEMIEGVPGIARMEDPGCEDPRLIALAAEFGQTLQACQREGNTLSGALRQAWDGTRLESMSKAGQDRSTKHHISLIGHITPEELERTLPPTWAIDGTANRWLVCLTRRSRIIRELVAVPEQLMEDLARSLAPGLEWGKSKAEAGLVLTLDGGDDGTADRVRRKGAYDVAVRSAVPGEVGVMRRRADSNMLRVASIYAAIDGSPVIRAPHMVAAREVIRYCMDSVGYLWREHDLALDPQRQAREAILAVLKVDTDGATLGDLADHFQVHPRELAEPLRQLQGQGLAEPEYDDDPKTTTAARDRERWRPLDLL